MEKFSKYEALGNDFVLLDRRAKGGDIDAAQARRWCDRHLGIGADGVLVLLPAEGVDAQLRIHNPDGSVAQMCGNGLRCVARYLGASLGGAPRPLLIGTDVGVREARLEPGGATITVEIGPASFEAAHLPRAANGGAFVEQLIDGQLASAVSVGNPHLVLIEAPLDDVAVNGPKLEHFPGFPERTNVEFCRQDAGGLEVRVWERGAGLTQACGSGAGAAVAAYVRAGRLVADSWHRVTLPGGVLEVRFDSADARVWLRGNASRVFEGTFAND